MTKNAKIMIISNISVEAFFNTSLDNETQECSFEYIFESLNFENEIKNDEDIDLIICFLNFETLYPNAVNDIVRDATSYIEKIKSIQYKCSEFYFKLKKEFSKPIFWIGFEDFFLYNYYPMFGLAQLLGSDIDYLNIKIKDFLCNGEDQYLDFKGIIASVGIYNAFNCKYKCLWNMPYSTILINKLKETISQAYLSLCGKSKKCIVIDCDNVLWGGILSEIGTEKICLSNNGMGKYYYDFQRFLLTLYYNGIILAVCSKNEYNDVLAVFREHTDMLLKEDNIACFKVNWDNKVDNIIRISSCLNISLDSMVFVDDSDFEIQSVKMLIPEVHTIKFTNDYNMYKCFGCLYLKSGNVLDEVLKRHQTYKTNDQRELLLLRSSSFDEFLKSLELVIDIHKTHSIELNRIAELSQRTNKCTNGKRYFINQLLELKSVPSYSLYTVSAKDRFSDLGIVGAIGIENNKLDLFCLSCRALGRGIEEKMLLFVNNYVTDYCFSLTDKNVDLFNKLREQFGAIENH